MVLTSNSDFYGAVHDEGINKAVKHLMRQRPSMFNYGTAMVKADPTLLCSPIDAAPAVTELITVMPRIPLLPAGAINLGQLSDLGLDLSEASNLGLDFAVQLTDLQVDFHPGDAFTLPPELNPSLQSQRLAFRAKVCGGLSCIPKNIRQKFPVDTKLGNPGMIRKSGRAALRRSRAYEISGRYSSKTFGSQLCLDHTQTKGQTLSTIFPVFPLFPVDKFECFCIELFGTGQSKFQGQAGNQKMLLYVDGIELKDIEPKGLENSIECYMLILLERVVLPQLSDVISELAFRLQEIPPLSDDPGDLGSIQISASTTAPNNPAIEDYQLKLFLNLEHLELNIPPITIGNGGGLPTPIRTVRSRTRTGPAHVTGAVSEAAFQRIFAVIRDTGRFKINVNPQTLTLLGVTGSASAKIEFHLENGRVEFRSDGTMRISELDIKWDRLDLTLGLNIKPLCFEVPVPVLWPPFYEMVNLGCLFEENPDLSFTLHFPTAFKTEISLNAGLKTYYGLGSPNEWLAYIAPSRVDIDFIDIADTVGDIFNTVLNAAINTLGLPSWAGDVVDSIVDLVRGLLDIPDDIGEWLQSIIFDTLGVESTIMSYVTIWLADSMPIFRLEDPVEVMEANGNLIPVRIPIEYLGAKINNNEMSLVLDLGE